LNKAKLRHWRAHGGKNSHTRRNKKGDKRAKTPRPPSAEVSQHRKVLAFRPLEDRIEKSRELR